MARIFLLVIIILSGSVIVFPLDSASTSLTITDKHSDARSAAEISSLAMDQAKIFLQLAYEQNITQGDVSNHLDAIMRAEGADQFLSFQTLVMSGKDLSAAMLHGNPFDDGEHIINPLTTDPIVMIDMGAKHNGFSSDITRTFFFENAPVEMLEAYEAVLAAEQAIFDAIRPGVLIADIDAIVHEQLADYYSRDDLYIHRNWGHGISTYVHAAPRLGNDTGDVVLEQGMVLAIEPGIYFDTGLAVRVEDDVIVTENGYELITDAPKQVKDVMIYSNQSHVSVTVTAEKYDYGQTTEVTLDVQEAGNKVLIGASYFDGYNWHEMVQASQGTSVFEWSYNLGYNFSSYITSVMKINFEDSTMYWTQDLSAEPGTGIERDIYPWIGGTNTGYDIPFQDGDTWKFSSDSWEFNFSGAKMIRIHFKYLSPPGYYPFAIMDAEGKLVIDYCASEYREDFWSPWVRGDTVKIVSPIINPENPVGYFEFKVDKMAIQSGGNTSQSMTTPTRIPGYEFQIFLLGILVINIVRKYRKKQRD